MPAHESGPTINKFTAGDQEHPAAFTQWWATAQVLSYCPPAGIVCDPFTGSGTVGIVAVRHGRSFVGGDLGARERDGRRWAEISRERAEAELIERTLAAAATNVRGGARDEALDGHRGGDSKPPLGQLALLVPDGS